MSLNRICLIKFIWKITSKDLAQSKKFIEEIVAINKRAKKGKFSTFNVETDFSIKEIKGSLKECKIFADDYEIEVSPIYLGEFKVLDSENVLLSINSEDNDNKLNVRTTLKKLPEAIENFLKVIK